MLIIDAPHFYAALLHANGRVVKTAPILRYMLGWNVRSVADYCRRKGWRMVIPPK